MGWMNDLRLAARGLRRNPAFSGVVVLTLGIGIGLSTAVFSVVNGVLLQPLPFDGDGRLVYVQAGRASEGIDDALVSGGDWRALREGVPALNALEAIGTIRQTLTGAGLPRMVQVGWVSPGFLSMLRVSPAVGRLPGPSDPPGTAVVSHSLWANQMAADPDVVDRTVSLDGHSYTVVGVLPAAFRLELPERGGARLPEMDIWKVPDNNWQNGDVWGQSGPEFGMLRMVGALSDGSTLQTVQAQADAVLAGRSAEDTRYEAAGFTLAIHDLHERLTADSRPTLLLLMGAVGFVLLIACANVANLLLVRAQGRRRELAVRVAIGASAGRVVRFLLVESMIVAAAGSAVGLTIASGLVAAMPLMASPDLPRIDAVSVDGLTALFAVSAGLLTTLLVGVAPAALATRADPSSALGNARAGAPRGAAVRNGLVVTQVALSLVLLVGAGLLVTSLARLSDVDVGFEVDDLHTFAVSIPGTEYGWPEEAGRYYRDVQEGVAQLPGVTAAGVVWPMPFGGSWSGDMEAGAGVRRPIGVVPYYLATEEYFPTMGIPLVSGRLFAEGDDRYSVVLSERAAQRAFPDGSSLGRVVTANPWGRGLEEYQVIGVVGDVRQSDLRQPTEGGVYFDARAWSWVDWEVHVMVRAATDAGVLVPMLREAVASIDPAVPVARNSSMKDLVDRRTATARFVLSLLGVFSLAAGVLAAVGLYGVVSYSVGMRRKELGIRMALGSGRASIQRMVVAQGLAMAGLGVVVGGVASILLGGVLEAYLFEVSPGDPGTVIVAAAALGAAAVIASWLPARRAGRTNPVEVLKAE